MFGFFRVILVITIMLPVSAFAGRVENSIVTQLQDQGFTQIQINRTWLGRSRIVAKSKNYTREIVVNPATGAILRDYWKDVDGKGSVRGLLNPEAIAASNNSDDRSETSEGSRSDGRDVTGESDQASNGDIGDIGGTNSSVGSGGSGGSENARGTGDGGISSDGGTSSDSGTSGGGSAEGDNSGGSDGASE